MAHSVSNSAQCHVAEMEHLVGENTDTDKIGAFDRTSNNSDFLTITQSSCHRFDWIDENLWVPLPSMLSPSWHAGVLKFYSVSRFPVDCYTTATPASENRLTSPPMPEVPCIRRSCARDCSSCSTTAANFSSALGLSGRCISGC